MLHNTGGVEYAPGSPQEIAVGSTDLLINN